MEAASSATIKPDRPRLSGHQSAVHTPKNMDGAGRSSVPVSDVTFGRPKAPRLNLKLQKHPTQETKKKKVTLTYFGPEVGAVASHLRRSRASSLRRCSGEAEGRRRLR